MAAGPDPGSLAKLREPFGPEHVGKLPKITCPHCSKAPGRCCQEHSKSKCAGCDNYITSRHIHIDYVGHGAVTHRLLDVDPAWSWEPLAFDHSGMPLFAYDENLDPISFWIRLTICGVTRLGVGTCLPGQTDAEKVLIGDALRNAAMRFGVALDLWVKGHGEDDERSSATDERSGPDRGRRSEERVDPELDRQRAEIQRRVDDLPADKIEELKGWVTEKGLPAPERLTREQAKAVTEWLDNADVDEPATEQAELPEVSNRNGMAAAHDAYEAQHPKEEAE